MTKPINIKKKRILNGLIDLDIPIIEFGNTGKTLSIVSGIHGDERESLLIINELLKNLPTNINGKVRIILASNVSANLENRRIPVRDNLDINRVFPGKENGTVTERTAFELLKLIKDSNAVIDLHSFNLITPLMGIIVGMENFNENLALMKAFSPEHVWHIDIKDSDEKKFGMSLGANLNKLRVTNITIEVNNFSFLDEETVFECVNGILNVMCFLGIIKEQVRAQKEFPLFKREACKSRNQGIFIPLKKIFEETRKGELIGKFIAFPDFKEVKVISDDFGVLMQISPKRFVDFGDELFAIGKEVKNESI